MGHFAGSRQKAHHEIGCFFATTAASISDNPIALAATTRAALTGTEVHIFWSRVGRELLLLTLCHRAAVVRNDQGGTTDACALKPGGQDFQAGLRGEIKFRDKVFIVLLRRTAPQEPFFSLKNCICRVSSSVRSNLNAYPAPSDNCGCVFVGLVG